MNLDEPISKIMTRSVHTAGLEDTVENVEERLGSCHVSSMPIVDAKGEIFGIITISDLLRFHESGKNPNAVQAWELCTYRPVCVSPAATIREVAELMVKNRIRHIIVSENRAVVGFVSAFDFIEKYVLDERA